MDRYEFLQAIHEVYRPRSYLEIGVRAGRSLALSRTRTIGVDPAFEIKHELNCDLQLVQATSDDFFARADPLAHFPGGGVDLAFVDGMHLFEFALRDFMNVERHAAWTSVILVDDALPRNSREASRERAGMVAWTGDVFKLTEVVRRHRPDLLLFQLDTKPTGLLLVLGADPGNTTLAERYDEIVAEHVHPDPQRVPDAVLRREAATDPASLAASGLWAELRKARDSERAREAGWPAVVRSASAAARPAPVRELRPSQERKVGRRAVRAVRRRLRPLRRRLRRVGR